jgi:putative RNA 2'-phosphotransferase
MKDKTKRTSKFLSYVLRHNPAEVDLELDENGWVSIEQLINNANTLGKDINRELIKLVVVTNDKQRFAISDDGEMIRANQGHSVEIELDLDASVPPAVLLHGTAEKNLGAITSNGLSKMNRHHVHLSECDKTASAVGRRYGKLILLEIDTIKMISDGFQFFKSENNVWLVDSVPAQYITVLKKIS